VVNPFDRIGLRTSSAVVASVVVHVPFPSCGRRHASHRYHEKTLFSDNWVEGGGTVRPEYGLFREKRELTTVGVKMKCKSRNCIVHGDYYIRPSLSNN